MFYLNGYADCTADFRYQGDGRFKHTIANKYMRQDSQPKLSNLPHAPITFLFTEECESRHSLHPKYDRWTLTIKDNFYRIRKFLILIENGTPGVKKSPQYLVSNSKLQC